MRTILCRLSVFLLVCLVAAVNLSAADFKLTNGDVYSGRVASANDDGVVFTLDSGGFSSRVSWARLSQESLKELAKNPLAAKFAEPFIDIPIEVKQKEKVKKKEIIIKDVPRVEAPSGKPRFFSSLGSPVMLALIAALYAANLFAAFHIAKYRNKPVPIVLIVSLIFPVMGPLLYLSMPTEGAAPSTQGDGSPAGSASTIGGPMDDKKPNVSGLGVAAHAKPAAAADAGGTQVFKREDVAFDRRFFETKFSGFFRMMPSDPDKVLVFRTAKGEIVGRRISRISANEIHVQLLRGSSEAAIIFGEISEVILRHKDAK